MRRHISVLIARVVIFPVTFWWARFAGLVGPGQTLAIDPPEPPLRPAGAALAALTLPAIAVATQGHPSPHAAMVHATAPESSAAAGAMWAIKEKAAAHVAEISAVTLGTYTVKPGDTLSGISAKLFGSEAHWPALWWPNRNKIPNPDEIEAGQVLRVGSSELTTAVVTAAYDAIPKPPAPVVVTAVVQPQAQPVTAAQPVQAAPVTQGNVAPFGSAFQQCVIERESGGNPGAVNASSGAGGLYQFLPSTWAGLGYPGLPENAPVWMQNQAFAKLYAEAGTSPWAPSDGC